MAEEATLEADRVQARLIAETEAQMSEDDKVALAEKKRLRNQVCSPIWPAYRGVMVTSVASAAGQKGTPERRESCQGNFES